MALWTSSPLSSMSFLASTALVPCKANDDGDIDGAHVLVSVDHALRHPVTTDDAAEDVDQDGLHGLVIAEG